MPKLILSLWVNLVCEGSRLCDPQAPKKDSFRGFLRLQRQMNQHIKIAKPGDIGSWMIKLQSIKIPSQQGPQMLSVSLPPSLFSNNTKLQTQLCLSLA